MWLSSTTEQERLLPFLITALSVSIPQLEKLSSVLKFLVFLDQRALRVRKVRKEVLDCLGQRVCTDHSGRKGIKVKLDQQG